MKGVLIGWVDDTRGVVTQKDMKRSERRFRTLPCTVLVKEKACVSSGDIQKVQRLFLLN
jgi:hypothetical protein